MRERELFLAALDIEDPAARQAHLQAECADDVELLARVESLLASHVGASQFLNTPVVEQIAEASDAGAATILAGNGSTQDDEPDATALHIHGPDAMTKPQDDGDDGIPLGYLEPSTKPGSLGRLGHYEVLEVIGRGAFGTVLRAFDEKLQRVVAIKVMAPELAATSPARKRFLREAQASAAIRHEHVVSIHAVEEKPIPYLVMEFIPGLTLQNRLDERGPLDVLAVLQIGRQIAEGLAAAHAQDLIHRDIKPANILLETGAREMVKVTDFGLARAADDASLTQSGTIAGTPMYMAPEQAMGNKLDQRADLFSFGSVMYQMVSGRPPFRANGTLAVLKRLAEDTPRPIREIIPETPQWLCDIITKLHAKNPDERYQSAREIADVLANCEEQLKSHSGLKDFSLIPQAKTQPARWWKWVAVAVLVCPLLALGWYALNLPAARPKVAENGPIKPPTTDPIKSERDPSSVVTAQQKTPPPAVAPFDVAQARAHQEAWAKHLGVPVEYTNNIGMKFVLIPPGEFTMGSTLAEIEDALRFTTEGNFYHDYIKSEAPQHQVILTQPSYLGVHEVTQAQYERVMETNPSHFAPTGAGKDAVAGMDTATLPVEGVSWNDAAEFCKKLSQQEKLKPFYSQANETFTPRDGTGYRLPTEAEWEYSCRAGTTSKYWVGNNDEDLVSAGWFGTNSRGRPHVVGELKSNPFGLYDSHGNVWEWVQDGWEPTYYGQFQGTPALDPSGPSSVGFRRLLRGGTWFYPASRCRASFRPALAPALRSNHIGFRVSLPVDAVKAAIAASDTISSVTTTAKAKRRFASDEWIDVIPLIDPPADKWDVPQRTGKNDWRIEQGELVVGGDTLGSKLVLPLDSDWSAFECELEFTRSNGSSGLIVNLPPKLGECPLVIDAPGNNGGVWLGSRTKGVLLKEGAQIVTSQRATLRVEVRRQQGADRVSVFFDGANVSEWTGDRNAISNTYQEGFPHDRRVSLWIHPGGNEFVFHRIRVRMLDGGTAESLRPVPVSASFTAPKPAIAPFDAAQAKAHQEAWAKHLGVPVEYTNSIGMKFMLIPPGEFTMGSTAAEIEVALKQVAPDDKLWQERIKSEAPQHKVTLTQPIYLGVNEVTQAEYQRVIGSNPSHFAPMGMGKEAVAGMETTNLPVEQVSWNDAAEFCAKVSQQEKLKPFYFRAGESITPLDGTGYRLPSEAEWEFACRAGTTTKYWIGDRDEDLPLAGRFDANSGGRPHAVGLLKANPFGLHDIHGNVWEWVQDGWEATWYGQFQERPAMNPMSPISKDSQHLARGGEWNLTASLCRSACRNVGGSSARFFTLGFRVLLPVDAVKSALRETSPAVTKQEPLPTYKNSIGMEFVIVPQGKSWLGGGKDKLGDKEVEIPADFYLGRYEVTQEEWEKVMGENPSHFSRTGGGKDEVKDIPDADLKRFPVESVSWDQSQLFVEKLNTLAKETGWVYRLPKQTEWEYACRGGPMADKADSGFDFYFAKPTNHPLREQALVKLNKGPNRTIMVGSTEANRLGLFDMHRNVWEWCDDMNEAAKESGHRVHVGGGWSNIRGHSVAANIETALPSHRSNNLGLRLARIPSGTASSEAKSPPPTVPVH